MMAGGRNSNLLNKLSRASNGDTEEKVLRAEVNQNDSAAASALNLNESSGKSSNKKKKKKRNKTNAVTSAVSKEGHDGAISHKVMADQQQSQSPDNSIWILGDQEERLRIREFWISLSVSERKQLVKLEKEAVLKKMKEQQKQTCSCAVCGRRRNDIENQLEILYNTYYKELENMSTSTNQRRSLQSDIAAAKQNLDAEIPMPPLTDEADEDELDDEIEDCCLEEEYLVDNKYLFNGITGEVKNSKINDGSIGEFGSSLTVKGGILTVADDFLTGDGKKFLDLMEALSNRKVIRSDNAGVKNPNISMAEDSTAKITSLSDNEWDDYDEGSVSDDFEEDEELHISDQQRLEEGRRMFQIFAAKMFEQRVLAAYREKAALDRAARLMQELEEEENAKKRDDERKKKEKEEAKQRKLEKEKEKQRLLKLKQEQDKALVEEKRLKEEEARNKIKEEQKLKQQKAAAAKEESRLAEKARAEAKQLEKQKQKERQKALEEKIKKEAEEKIRKEAEEKARKEAEQRAALKLAEEKKCAEEEARKVAEEKRTLEIAKQEKKRAAAEAAANEKRKAEEEAIARARRFEEENELAALAIAEEKIEKSRSLADEHSKKLKHRLETRAAQNAKKQIKEKKATKVSSILKPSPVPNAIEVAASLEQQAQLSRQHLENRMNYSPQFQQHQMQHQPEMTASVRQFFESTSVQQQQTLLNPPPGMTSTMLPPGYNTPIQESSNFPSHHSIQPVTSRLGIPLQPMNNTKGNRKIISNLTGLWSNSPNDPVPQTHPIVGNSNIGRETSGNSVWNSSGIASGFNMGGLFEPSTSNHYNSKSSKSNLYEDTTPDFLNIQQELLLSENMNSLQHKGMGRLGLHGIDKGIMEAGNAWAPSSDPTGPTRLSGAPPPGFHGMASSNTVATPPPGFGIPTNHQFNGNRNQKQQSQGGKGISPPSVSSCLWGSYI